MADCKLVLDTTSESSDDEQNSPKLSNILEFDIGFDDARRIIGPSGSKIKEIQRTSHTNIKIDSSSCVPRVKIYGKPSAQLRARQLIDGVLGDFEKLTVSDPPKKLARPPKKQQESDDDDDEIPSIPTEVFEYMSRKITNETRMELAMRGDRLRPIIRDVYIEHRDIAKLTPEEVERFRSENNISIRALLGEESICLPNPVATFEHAFEPYPEILSKLKNSEFEKPTPIQCQAWPVLMKGYDMVGISESETGKSLAFLLPALIHINKLVRPNKKKSGPVCLILIPGFSLSLQVWRDIATYANKDIQRQYIRGSTCLGGEFEEVKKGVEILMATPKTVTGLLKQFALDVLSISYIVIDSVDSMMVHRFEDDLKYILSHTHRDKQIVMTSANWSPKAQKIAEEYMKTPVLVQVN